MLGNAFKDFVDYLRRVDTPGLLLSPRLFCQALVTATPSPARPVPAGFRRTIFCDMWRRLRPAWLDDTDRLSPDDNTHVMTASDAMRTSYGRGCDSDFT